MPIDRVAGLLMRMSQRFRIAAIDRPLGLPASTDLKDNFALQCLTQLPAIDDTLSSYDVASKSTEDSIKMKGILRDMASIYCASSGDVANGTFQGS